MAQTEQRAGFRLWGLGARGEDEPAATPVAPPEEAEALSGQDGAEAIAEAAPETVAAVEASPVEAIAEAADEAVAVEVTASAAEADTVEASPRAEPATPPSPAATAPHAPTRFLVELARAMQAAAAEERTRMLEGFRVEAKTYNEGIHARAAEEVGQLKQQTESDVAAVRDWSKAEIARIREETERRITTRRSELDGHLDEHAALIEREIERVQAAVTVYEREMDFFFQKLTAETDPAVIAELARLMPDSPALETTVRYGGSLGELLGGVISDETPSEAPAALAAPAATEPPAEPVAEAVLEEAVLEEAVLEDASASDDGAVLSLEAAPEPVAEAAGSSEPAEETEPSVAARLAALGMAPDLATAEREAVVDVANSAEPEGSAAADEKIEELPEESIAARLAGLVPSSETPANGRPGRLRMESSTHLLSEQVIVLGLTSVASIASFKRHLGRLPGVVAVGVSSGPDGEFIFKVNHEPVTNLRELVPTLPGFSARVSEAGEGILRVTARDPESDAR